MSPSVETSVVAVIVPEAETPGAAATDTSESEMINASSEVFWPNERMACALRAIATPRWI